MRFLHSPSQNVKFKILLKRFATCFRSSVVTAANNFFADFIPMQRFVMYFHFILLFVCRRGFYSIDVVSWRVWESVYYMQIVGEVNRHRHFKNIPTFPRQLVDQCYLGIDGPSSNHYVDIDDEYDRVNLLLSTMTDENREFGTQQQQNNANEQTI